MMSLGPIELLNGPNLYQAASERKNLLSTEDVSANLNKAVYVLGIKHISELYEFIMSHYKDH